MRRRITWTAAVLFLLLTIVVLGLGARAGHAPYEFLGDARPEFDSEYEDRFLGSTRHIRWRYYNVRGEFEEVARRIEADPETGRWRRSSSPGIFPMRVYINAPLHPGPSPPTRGTSLPDPYITIAVEPGRVEEAQNPFARDRFSKEVGGWCAVAIAEARREQPWAGRLLATLWPFGKHQPPHTVVHIRPAELESVAKPRKP